VLIGPREHFKGLSDPNPNPNPNPNSDSRLKEGLYRHPWDDIAYIMPELAGPDARFEN